MFCCVLFFFKHKTAYEMRISDWSSDVCSSDLVAVLVALRAVAREVHAREAAPVRGLVPLRIAVDAAQHRRPRALEHEVAPTAERDGFAVAVDDVGLDPDRKSVV